MAYLADLNLEHAKIKQKHNASLQASSHDSIQEWGTIFRLREVHQVPHPPIAYNPTVHPAFVKACVWGNQYADLVLRFCAALKWPDPAVPHSNPITTAGITWHELAVAFIVNTGLQLPIWIRPETNKRAQPFPWQDSRVLALPIPKRSLREQSEAFRTIVLYLQGYSNGPIVPHYAKTGSTSLAQTGWGRAYTGGFALRPELPNSKAVQKTLMRYAEDLHSKPISSRWASPYAFCKFCTFTFPCLRS